MVGLISLNAQSVSNENFGKIVTYPVPECYSSGTGYTMTINGINVPLVKHEYKPYGTAVFNLLFSSFYFDGIAVIEIKKTSGTIDKYDISPKKFNITPVETSNSIKFAIDQPKHLYLNINGTEILIFAESILTNQPPSSGTGIFNITNSKYGASPSNSSTNNQRAKIQKAIDEASTYGKSNNTRGTVYVPAGVYYTTDLLLKDNVNLYLEGGSVLRGTGRSSDYGSDTERKTVLLLAGTSSDRVENVRIYGPGFIDANGITTAQPAKTSDLTDRIENCTGRKMRCIDAEYIRNIKVEDVIALEGTSWQVSFHEGNNLSVERVKVVGHRFMKHNDGIDVSACQDVVIRNCFSIGVDDNFCIKDDAFQPSINILIENVVGYSYSRTFKIGMQAYNAVRNCTIRNVDVIRSRNACHLQQIRGKNAIWEGILIENFAIDYNLQYAESGETMPPAPFRIQLDMPGGKARNITVKNFTYHGDNWAQDEWDSDLDNIGSNTSISNILFVNFKLGNSDYADNEIEANMDINQATIVDFIRDPNNEAPIYKNVPIPDIQNKTPTARITYTANNLAVSFDGSTSYDTDGTIVSYVWNFGDGTVGSGQKTSHTYAAAGTYNASLTVTDNKNASNKNTTAVTVSSDNVEVKSLDIEAEKASSQSKFSPFVVVNDPSASGGQYIVNTISTSTIDENNGGLANYFFILSGTATITFSVNANFPGGSDDSFFYRIDNGPWQVQNGPTTDGWQTIPITNFTDLSPANTHTLTILRREDGAKIDKITLSTTSNVTISEPSDIVNVTSINLPTTTLALEAGKTSQLTAKVSPTNATDKTVTWSSNNSAVATVDANGLVTAISVGSATITVKTNDGGFIATCTVTVSKIDNNLYEAELATYTNGIVKAGGTGQYVDIETGGKISWNINSTSNTTSNLTFSIASPSDNRSMGVYVNNVKKGVISTSLSAFSNKTVITNLNAGNNVIELRDSEGTRELDVDYVSVENITTTKLTLSYNNVATSGWANPEYTLDGDVLTPATKSGSTAAYIEYNLGGTYMLTSARINEDNAGNWQLDSWKLQYYNGSTWVDAFAYTNSTTAGWNEVAINGVETDKIRVYFQEDSYIEVFEVEVYGYTFSNKSGREQNTLPSNNTTEIDVKTYPNPFITNLYVDINIPEQSVLTVSIMDVSGKQVKFIYMENMPEGTRTEEINLTELQKGIYFAKFIISSNNNVTTKTIQIIK